MRLSDMLTEYIMEMLSDTGDAEIRRNELANHFGCVPSQINYVLTSRFTPEQGYIVESRRGGGGYIRITRVNADKSQTMMHIVNSVGDSLDRMSVEVMIKNLLGLNMINEDTARLLAAALSDRALAPVTPSGRDIVRASIFKNMILTLSGR
ncbi:MAG: CtsR family transcriptional regulator [Ruminococcaceae bacterium]|nr:CtsR family transcriptional regulator [Oscillospiraceae bacterium]